LAVRPLSADARRALAANRWPGNVRELENTLHRAVLLSGGETIGPEAIAMPDGTGLSEVVKTASLASQAAQMADTISRTMVGRTVADVERDLILDTLDHVLGNRTHAANILGISIRTLRNKLNQYADEGIAVPAPGEQRNSAA
jgi:DNA-binding NtrC family response regulator